MKGKEEYKMEEVKQRRSLYLPSSTGLASAWEKYNNPSVNKNDWPSLCIAAVDSAVEQIKNKKIMAISELFKFLRNKREEIAEKLGQNAESTPEETEELSHMGIYYGKYGVMRQAPLVTYMSSKNRYADQMALFAKRIENFVKEKYQDVEVKCETEGDYTAFSVTFLGNMKVTVEHYTHLMEFREKNQIYKGYYSSINMTKYKDEIVEMSIDHASVSHFDDIFSYLDTLGQPLFSGSLLSESEKYKLLAEIQWCLSQAAFCELGSASINILVDRALNLSLGLPLLDYKEGTPIDLEAISTTNEEFVASFKEMYQEPSSLKISGKKSSFFQTSDESQLPSSTNHQFVPTKQK